MRPDLVFTCSNDRPLISEEPARSLLTAATSDVGKDVIKRGSGVKRRTLESSQSDEQKAILI